MLINIIGLGKVGKTLAKLFFENKLAEIAGIYNRSEKNGMEGINFIGQGVYHNDIKTLPKADITFITTVDDVIPSISAEYALNCNLKAGTIVAHCSGALSANCMDALREKGCYICSIHPMHSFIDPVLSVQKFTGTYCAIEGDKHAQDLVRDLFTAVGARVINIASEKKIMYHAAGVFASNYLLTLAEQSLNCLHSAQVIEDDALGLLINIMQNTINNLAAKKKPSAALTGPLKRGDFSTIEAHKKAFADEKAKEFYEFMLSKTMDLVK